MRNNAGDPAAPAWWLALGQGGRVELLGHSECLRLIGSGRVGRLAYVTSDGPRVVPVNYTTVGESVIVRLAPGSEVARAAVEGPVAFEVDAVDDFLQSGWSVLALGQMVELSVELRAALGPRETPEPYASGQRSLHLHLPLDRLSGRRIHPA